MFWNMMNSYGYTENNALTHTTSGSAVLNMFAMGGAMRNRSDKEIIEMFSSAILENSVLAMKCLFYLRDCRGGAGEKRFFRVVAKWINDTAKDKDFPFDTFVDLIEEYGSWKDVFSIFDVDTYKQAVAKRVTRNIKSGTPTLMEKYMPSIGGSKNKDAEKLAEYMGMTPRQYRKYLSASRAKLDIVEVKMSSNNWGKIKYSSVPSKAMLNYAKAFSKHDEERVSQYLNRVKTGEEKINTGVLFPYEIFREVRNGNISNEAAQVIWDNLPDYTNGKNAIVVADTSGSMTWNGGLPILVSTSLALYFAERNKGKFNGSFITFSDKPSIVNAPKEGTLYSKMKKIEATEWGGSTNLVRVFDLILSAALNESLPQDEMPSAIYIISDMEFNEATYGYRGGFGKTNYQAIKEKYTDAGYDMPNIVFWNVNSRQNNVPVKMHESGVILVSGASPSTFKIAISDDCSPEKFMMGVLESERYKYVEKLFVKN